MATLLSRRQTVATLLPSKTRPPEISPRAITCPETGAIHCIIIAPATDAFQTKLVVGGVWGNVPFVPFAAEATAAMRIARATTNVADMT